MNREISISELARRYGNKNNKNYITKTTSFIIGCTNGASITWRENAMSNKNKTSWNEGAAAYSALSHNKTIMSRITENPANAFHHTTWEMINKYIPDLCGKKVCVPSSGDNHAVFAFAMLGATATRAEVDHMYDWHNNPMAALPNWISIVVKKNGGIL
jgi:hypothetical protein